MVLNLYNLKLDVIYYRDKLLLSPMNSENDINKKNNLMLSELMLKYGEKVISGVVYELELECYDSDINLPNLRFIV